jgi:hypothetical protein
MTGMRAAAATAEKCRNSPSCVGDDVPARADHASRGDQQFAQLGVGDGGGFAGGAGHYDARRAVGEMELEEAGPGVEIDAAVRLHRGHERHQAAGEHA